MYFSFLGFQYTIVMLSWWRLKWPTFYNTDVTEFPIGIRCRMFYIFQKKVLLNIFLISLKALISSVFGKSIKVCSECNHSQIHVPLWLHME